MAVWLLESVADNDAVNIVGHRCLLLFEVFDNGGFVTVNVDDLYSDSLVRADLEGLRSEPKLVFIFRYITTGGWLEVRCLFEVKKHLAVNKAIAVVVFVEVPG